MKIRGIRRRSRQSGAPSFERGAAERTSVLGLAISPRAREHVTRLVVEVGNRASQWREAAVDAELAYGRWKSALQTDRPDAAAVYLAAIEREEKAADENSRALEACWGTSPATALRPL